MKRMMVLLLVFLANSISMASEIPVGWNRTVDNKKNTIVFKLKDQNIDIMVKYYPTELLEGRSVDAWVRNKLFNSKAPRGEWVGEGKKVNRRSYNRAFGFREFRKADGDRGMLGVIGFSADLLYVRPAMVLYASNVDKIYYDQAFEIFRNIDDIEIENAKAEWRGLDLETGTPKVRGIKKGGPIKPGRYVGKETVRGDARSTYSIMLYDNGEYEFLNTKKEHIGHYVYSERFAKLYIKDPFYNSIQTYKSYCVYGVNEKTGKPVIYAYDDPSEYRLSWIDPVDRLSPSQRKKIKSKKKRGYPYVTNPGEGLPVAQIETILYVYEESAEPGNRPLNEEIYLLTKDGRVMDNLPVAPNILDVSKSRNREPDRWGWWKFDGQRYSFAWNVDKSHYVVPKGKQKKTEPIPFGTHLQGVWLASSTHSGSDFSSTEFRGERFTKAGRFVNINRKEVKVNGKKINKDDGRGSLQPDDDQKGLYEFDGYSLTIRYDNGDEWRIPTFTLDGRLKYIWFRGVLLDQQS
ncbi:MAG: hypothetical protein ABW104_09960 [Candidatus Thiodiazotropha sp. 6PLUC2]